METITSRDLRFIIRYSGELHTLFVLSGFITNEIKRGDLFKPADKSLRDSFCRYVNSLQDAHVNFIREEKWD